jgi:D-tyrosyl-tRNA(Tyr) deacylase
MRAVIQRVREARVEVNADISGSIGPGILVLLGISKEDTPADADYLVEKIINLRIFQDEKGKMNRSLRDTAGELLVVSQFTLYGNCRKGRRPSFDRAAPAEEARTLYDYFVQSARSAGIPTETGQFQAAMSVHLVNEGPVTLICESRVTNATYSDIVVGTDDQNI